MRRLLLAAIGLSAFVLVSDAQVRPIYDMGAAGPTQVLQRLQTTASVLHTGAHRHNQEAGYLTPLAYKAAADPNECPEQLREGLRPWQAKKLYRGNFGNARPDTANPVLQVQEGIIDPAAGRSYAEISFEGRSQHKT